MAMVANDEVFVAPSCDAVPRINGVSSTALIKLSRNTTNILSQEVARGKPTTQSDVVNMLYEPPGKTTISPPLLGYSNLAVDGNIGTSYLAGSCTHTGHGPNPWWRVDLLASLDIVMVEVWNRADVNGSDTNDDITGTGNRLKNFEVYVGDSGPAGFHLDTRCGTNHTVQEGRMLSVDCTGTKGRYVTITIPVGYKTLALCEVRVYERTPYDALSTFVSLPTTLSSPSTTTLKMCATTREMRAYGEFPVAGEFRQLDDNIKVIKLPALPGGFDTSIRLITDTAPDFKFERAESGDFFFLTPTACGPQPNLMPIHRSSYPPNTPASRLQHHLDFKTGLMQVSKENRFVTPYAPKLSDGAEQAGKPVERVLTVCYATVRSEGDTWEDFVTLQQRVHIIPEPTGVLNAYQLRQELDRLYFNQPMGTSLAMTPPPPPSSIAGQIGDIFILARDTCHNVAGTDFKMPKGPSGRVILEEGGIASVKAIAGGMLNELEVYENYRICFATAESEGDAQTDFVDLASYMIIRIDERAPMFEVDLTVGLGEDIVVRWHANHGLEERYSHSKDWIGLYRKGECSEENAFKQYGEYETPLPVITKHNSIHECYLGWVNLEDGKLSGVARFPVSSYKSVGEYEVRYFLGDSRHGQGYVCRGMRKRAGQVAYLHCVLEAAATSSTITVAPNSAEAQSDNPSDIGKVPGLESYCDGPLCFQ
jgi:hypothetical protein